MSTAPMAEWTLMQIVEGMKLAGEYAHKTIQECGRTCRRYEAFTGGPHRACDVTAEMLERYLAWQIQKGYLHKDALKQCRAVAALVRRANPTKLPRYVSRRPDDGDTNEQVAPAQWPLVRIVNELLRPAGSRAKGTLVKYRASCRRFNRFRGGSQQVCDVTPELLDEFLGWMQAQGYAESFAVYSCENVAAVVRRVDAARLPMKYRRVTLNARRQSFADAEIAGTLEAILTNEYFPVRSRINAKLTEKQYAHAVGRFSAFLGRPAILADLNDLSLGKWMASMRDEGLQARTINGYMNKLRAFWTWAAKRRKVNDFPTIENAPEPRRIPRAWTREQLQALMDATSKMPGSVRGVPAGLWWRALHLVAWDCGERTGALMALRWEDFDPSTGDLESPAEIRKGGKKSMLYHLKPVTVAALEAIRKPERSVIFKWSDWDGNGKWAFYARYKELLKLAGLPYERRRSALQKVRRTFASFIEQAGGNATAALDHTARSVTVNSYLDPRVIKAPPANVLLFEIAPVAAKGGPT